MSDLLNTITQIFFWLGIAFCIAVPLLYIKLRNTLQKLDEAKQTIEKTLQEFEDAKQTIRRLKDVEEEARLLSKYRKVLDADREAEKIRDEANYEARRILRTATLDSKRILAEAQETKAKTDAQVAELMSEARKKSKEMRERAKEIMNEAATQSRYIIQSAKARAEEIAGEALAAKGKADQYRKAARAIKNLIDGYGDEYVIPSRSVLDDLAEEFSHKEAGQELKKARNYTKQLIKNGLAAECDYVEKSRRNFAILFVLDAFNGKVDSVLSKVKHDNYGKLKQAILDAFNLVNHNGAAFRNARITKQYLEARLNELRWAVAVHQLKLEEREEQRRIREAIREEERARREYEKAIREAEKEERMLQRAMKKARKQLEAASAEQRQMLEQQIRELQEKLQEAESKSERALSMAQQTKRGHVYVISNIGSFGENVFKVGLTRRLEPEIRVRELGDASVPFPFDIHAMIFSEDAPALETKLHHYFQDRQINKVNPRKEFFRFGISEIKKVVDELGIEAHWTMKAEAQEYRESLAIEAAQQNEQQHVQEQRQPAMAEAVAGEGAS